LGKTNKEKDRCGRNIKLDLVNFPSKCHKKMNRLLCQLMPPSQCSSVHTGASLQAATISVKNRGSSAEHSPRSALSLQDGRSAGKRGRVSPSRTETCASNSEINGRPSMAKGKRRRNKGGGTGGGGGGAQRARKRDHNIIPVRL